MRETVFARQLENGIWQWRKTNSEGQWESVYFNTGDRDAIAEYLPDNQTAVYLMLSGQSVVSCFLPADIPDRRQLAKLIPYELEEQLIEDVEEFHFSIGAIENEHVSVVYMKSDYMGRILEEWQPLSSEVQHCIADYMSLIHEANGGTVVYEDNMVYANFGSGRGFAVEGDLARVVLANIASEYQISSTLNIVAESEEQINMLVSWLPEAWRQIDYSAEDIDEELEEGESHSKVVRPDVVTHEGGFWDWVDIDLASNKINLRQGRFSRQLPFARWISIWRKPAIFMGVAFVLAFFVAMGEYFVAKGEHKRIIAEMNAIYKKAVPNGRPGDPERVLLSKVKGLGGGGKAESSNLMLLLDGFAQAYSGAKGIKLSGFRYSSDQKELRLNIEGDGFSDLENLRVAVEGKGFSAELLRVSAKGDKHSARMKIVEVKK